MNCAEAKTLLSDWMDGELEEEKAELLKEHLAVCPVCKEEYETLNFLRKQLKDLGDIPLPDGLDEAWKAACAADGEIRVAAVRKRNQLYRKVSAVAAVFVIGIVGISLQQSGVLSPDSTDKLPEGASYRSEQSDSSLENKESEDAAPAMVEFVDYDALLAEALKGKDFTVISAVEEPPGLMTFEIRINEKNEKGEETVKTVIYIGQDGKVWEKE